MKAAFVSLILMAAMPAAAASPPEDGYRSSTADYTPYREAPIADWRMANEAMGPMHGPMGHGMGHMMVAPASAASVNEAGSSAPQSGSMETGSHHHHMGGQP